jgi:hypothetical protein
MSNFEYRESVSIREYFAIRCLQPLIHGRPEFTYPIMVKRAVVLADMLIEELKK